MTGNNVCRIEGLVTDGMQISSRSRFYESLEIWTVIRVVSDVLIGL